MKRSILLQKKSRCLHEKINWILFQLQKKYILFPAKFWILILYAFYISQYWKWSNMSSLIKLIIWKPANRNFRILYDYVQIKSLHDKFCYLTVLLIVNLQVAMNANMCCTICTVQYFWSICSLLCRICKSRQSF